MVDETPSMTTALLATPQLRDRELLEPWENPGWATTSHLEIVKKDGADGSAPIDEPHHAKLGQLTATAICGNDLTASCLYTAGVSATAAGVYAAIPLFLVVVMLWFFRAVYGEVGTALPLNGGAYNVLLNTTSKSTASIAACLTILSYVATGVVSAAEACAYLHNVWDAFDVYTATIFLLIAFAFLNLMGISESAIVAAAIFCVHIATLTLLLVVCTYYLLFDKGFELFKINYHSPLQPALGKALFYGFSAASLGITGFETSSNFIEEQAEGVFLKTLRNMWFGALAFNPTLSLLAAGIVPLEEVDGNESTLLSRMGRVAGGRWLEVVVSVDAFLVLAGSVITAFVGVTGLIKRLTGDRCLPGFLLHTNRWRGTNHWIILVFLGICVSMYVLLNGEVDQLSAIYSLAFLCVMSLFAVGDMLLKFKRNAIPRQVRSTWLTTILAWTMVMTALVATALKEPDTLNYFILYFLCTASIFAVTFWRIQLLKIALYSIRRLFKSVRPLRDCCDRFLTNTIRNINQQSVVFFAKTDSISMLNKAVLYVRANEHTHWVRIVHCAEKDSEIPPNLVKNVEVLNSAYPKIRIDCVIVQGSFDRQAIDSVAQQFNVPHNMMFITCPSQNFRHKIESLGGVRVITHHQKAKDPRRDSLRSQPTSLVDGRPQFVTQLAANGVPPTGDAATSLNPAVYTSHSAAAAAATAAHAAATAAAAEGGEDDDDGEEDDWTLQEEQQTFPPGTPLEAQQTVKVQNVRLRTSSGSQVTASPVQPSRFSSSMAREASADRKSESKHAAPGVAVVVNDVGPASAAGSKRS